MMGLARALALAAHVPRLATTSTATRPRGRPDGSNALAASLGPSDGPLGTAYTPWPRFFDTHPTITDALTVKFETELKFSLFPPNEKARHGPHFHH